MFKIKWLCYHDWTAQSHISSTSFFSDLLYLSASFLSVFFIRLLLAIVVVIVLFVFPFTSSIAMLPRVNDTNAIRSRMKDVLYRNLVPTDGMHCICNSISTILSVHLTRLGCPLPSQFEHHTKMLWPMIVVSIHVCLCVFDKCVYNILYTVYTPKRFEIHNNNVGVQNKHGQETIIKI